MKVKNWQIEGERVNKNQIITTVFRINGKIANGKIAELFFSKIQLSPGFVWIWLIYPLLGTFFSGPQFLVTVIGVTIDLVGNIIQAFFILAFAFDYSLAWLDSAISLDYKTIRRNEARNIFY